MANNLIITNTVSYKDVMLNVNYKTIAIIGHTHNGVVRVLMADSVSDITDS